MYFGTLCTHSLLQKGNLVLVCMKELSRQNICMCQTNHAPSVYNALKIGYVSLPEAELQTLAWNTKNSTVVELSPELALGQSTALYAATPSLQKLAKAAALAGIDLLVFDSGFEIITEGNIKDLTLPIFD